jgi:DNA repair protein RecN (Recombination protein N)
MRLRCLEIENYALIRNASMTFADGLTVCSGETGSGKTMLLGALGFVLGARALSDMISGDAARMRVSLQVELESAVREELEAEGFPLEPDEDALLVREMSAAGKSSARINGRPATTAQLRALGERIVDSVGQHEQQRLVSPKHQLDMLDRFAGETALQARARVVSLHARVREVSEELDRAQDAGARACADYAFAQYALREIDDAGVRKNEEIELRERRDYLANRERISSGLALAHEALIGGENAAIEGLGVAAQALVSAARFSEALRDAYEKIVALQSDANEIAVALSRELDATERDPRESENVGARLDEIERIKRKYGGTTESVLLERARCAETIERFETRDERLAALRNEHAAASEELARHAARLTQARVAAARLLEERVAQELRALAMPAARFAVVLETSDAIGAHGAERVAFLLAPNPGEPPRALAQAASGGELSRVLLALVSAIADVRERSALVFDEIDAGIGGAAANAVGARLGALAVRSQVLCITHLAQIASWADAHYVMSKRSEKDATRIELRALEAAPVVREEIARMLSGNTADAALRHAEQLLDDVRRAKVTA